LIRKFFSLPGLEKENLGGYNRRLTGRRHKLMFFTITLYISLAIFGLGLIYKVSTWFRYSLGRETRAISTPARVFAAIKGITLTLFSPKIFILVKVFVLDVLLQLKVLRQDFLKWAMHMCIYYGFLLLLLMHGLDKIVSTALFSNYYPTVNPFLFLRNFFGVLIIVGISIAIYRRFILRLPRLRTSPMDVYAIAILAVIMISGFLLESTKITSYTKFQDMVEEYTWFHLRSKPPLMLKPWRRARKRMK
jgi:nitrate reductase gamma subunit